eukprot:TRINITY_DN552_c1_g1_i2.p2 TRINITY_DN552_c1_g1~~TRINITY_DN552_c1_g1_i2.p2  ORF type:complete len:157 (+),score=22.65 TRINITY_DN552_c1_g1_i2:295-765(+)
MGTHFPLRSRSAVHVERVCEVLDAWDGSVEELDGGGWWRVQAMASGGDEEDDDHYDVTADVPEADEGWSCTCAQFLRWRGCKHVEAVRVKVVPGVADPRVRVAGPTVKRRRIRLSIHQAREGSEPPAGDGATGAAADEVAEEGDGAGLPSQVVDGV